MLARALLLDLDGTLVDSLADIAASANHVREHFGLEPLDRAVVRSMIGDGARVLLQRALAALDPAPDLDRAFAVFDAHHRDACTAEVTLYPGVREHLQRWHDDRIALAVVTNKPTRFAEQIVRHLDLAGLLPVVVGGDTLAERKPHPAPLRAALAMLGRPAAAPEDIAMVGDGIQDLRAGRAAGFRTVACIYGFGDPSLLRAEQPDEVWSAFGVRVDEG